MTMTTKTRWASVAVAAALALGTMTLQGQSPAGAQYETALDRYVARPDPSYKYSLVTTATIGETTVFLLDMTSQTWRSIAEVDRNVWRHWVTIIKPRTVSSATALLVISGGSNRNPAPESPDRALMDIATTTKSVVAEVRMVPNEPLMFADDKRLRTEDGIIAYTWDKFLRTGDEMWPARLPMTKAAVRAMDTVTAFLGAASGGAVRVDNFVVTGGSKRGWTAWTTAAVDKRVVGIIPMVIDLLNIGPSFEHHFAVYGYWAPAVADYEELGIMKWLSTPQYRALMRIEEPYEYRARLTVPKFIINAADDQFFVPDSSQFYFDALPGVKYLRYVPNADHSLGNSDAMASVLAAYNALVTRAPLPKFDWKIERNGTVRVRSTDRPSAVKLWQVTNPGARDFRLTTIGPRWTSTPLADQGGSVYVGRVAPPRRGWTAYFVEMTYPNALASAPFKFTTGVKVVPDKLPFLDESKALNNGKGGRH